MKRKRLLLGLLCMAVVLAAGLLFIAKNSIDFSTGICIETKNGVYMIVMERSPVTMHRRLGGKGDFPDLDTGDRIFVIHDGVAETYPGKTGVYLVLKLADGDAEDVPVQIMEQLTEMGWIVKE